MTKEKNTKQQNNSENKENLGRLSFKDMENIKTTPAMTRYLELKKENPDYLLFYRMGDFYELFFEDAVTVSEVLGLALTSRSKCDERPIPMCGVPFHAYEIYMSRLIKMGYKVAISEQMEDPKAAKKRGANAVVERDIVRLVTSGTITEDTILDAKKSNYMACVYFKLPILSISWLDISTGSFFTENLKTDIREASMCLSTALSRLEPTELLFDEKMLENQDFRAILLDYRDGLTPLSRSKFNPISAEKILKKAFNIEALEAFEDFSTEEIISSGVLLEYVENTQKGKLPKLHLPQRIKNSDLMEIDLMTRKSLELTSPINAGGMSLFQVLDKTVSGNGGRLLMERLSSPTLNVKEINDRLDMVSFFVDNPLLRARIRKLLHATSDVKRSLQRLSLGRGSPRDLFDIAETLNLVPSIKVTLENFLNFEPNSPYQDLPPAFIPLLDSFFDHSALVDEIERSLVENREELPALTRNGGFIKAGTYGDLDFLRNIRENAISMCEELKNKYIEETGVNALKIKNNNINGFYIEVPSKFADILLTNPNFTHKQTVLNAVRFTTSELAKIESEVLTADESALALELKIFEELTNYTLAQDVVIGRTADIFATLDVAASLAEVAVENEYVRPSINDSLDFEIIEGRHPVVEYAIKKESGEKFVGNNLTLDYEQDRIWLLTGPNMAGKSTFLRQNALIAIMAQMGSFVPAKSAKIGIIDKIFSRVGASDDLSRGRSTFMVEMVETATILNRATEHSFVILDEIGRGTATFDGLSIAWAVVEHLSEVNHCRTIFATHYHELTKLYKTLPYLTLHCMKTKEFNGEVVFMHEVIDGAADRSYGIHVAKLAGLPELALKRSEQVLKLLEEDSKNKSLSHIEDDLPLFANLKKEIEPTIEHPVIEALRNKDIDTLTPRDALMFLYELKEKI